MKQTITIQNVRAVELHDTSKVRTGDHLRQLWIKSDNGDTFVLSLMSSSPNKLRVVPVSLKGGGKSV